MRTLDVACSLFALLILICLLPDASAQDHCVLIEDCNSCLSNYSECAWCSDSDWPHPNCFVAGAWYINANCTQLTNFGSTATVRRSSPLDDNNQVTPTMFDVNLRAKQPVSQIIKVRPAAGYPIDSYYLMDFSNSMKDDLESLRDLAGNLTNEFAKVSENYRIGFGTFIDKNLFPYSYQDPTRKANPCYTGQIDLLTGEESSCIPSYAFKHEMGLKKSLMEFQDTLGKLSVSSNIDYPEGGFEALMQVAACNEKFGFRDKSRKIVIYASDAGIHIAGDGKLGGLVTPNEGKCQVDSGTGYYYGAEQQDYPTIEQVNQKLIENNIIPIFAIDEQFVDLYRKLSDHMTQLSDVGTLSSDSANIVELVRDALHRITSTINLVILNKLGYYVTIEPMCGADMIPNGCTNVQYGETIEFKVTFTLEECSKDLKDPQYIPIIIPGFETVFVTVTHQCGCDCYDNKVTGADVCSNHGEQVCGSCKCREEYFGRNCECSPASVKSDELCKMPGSHLVCSKQGRCECGECICRNPTTPPDALIPYVRYGEFCECSNYECPKGANGEICSGLGDCHCGQCYCNRTALGVPKIATTKGEACDCEISGAQCFNPSPLESNPTGEKMCSAHGTCECNRCICEPNYRGPYCEDCVFCGPLSCSTHIECVLCLSVKKQKADDPDDVDCSSACDGNGVHYQEVDARVDPDELEELGYKVDGCGQYDDDEYNCRVNFYIASENVTSLTVENSMNITIFYDKEIECDEFAIIWIILLIIGAILLIGLLLLLLWKWWAYIQDKKEFQKFEDDMAAAKWNTTQSPIYKKATTVHANPLFANM